MRESPNIFSTREILFRKYCESKILFRITEERVQTCIAGGGISSLFTARGATSQADASCFRQSGELFRLLSVTSLESRRRWLSLSSTRANSLGNAEKKVGEKYSTSGVALRSSCDNECISTASKLGHQIVGSCGCMELALRASRPPALGTASAFLKPRSESGILESPPLPE